MKTAIYSLSEIMRLLAADGSFYTVKNEMVDTKHVSWHDRFIDNGLEINYENPYYRIPTPDDTVK